MVDEPQQAPNHLSGRMGTGELIMSVLAFSAPLATTAGFIPVLLMFSGHTGPAIYCLVTLLLLIFSVGFVAMGRSVPNPGGFYAFVTAGLGRSAGLGGAFLAMIGYTVIGFFAPPFFAVTIGQYVTSLGGPEIPWYWYALGLVALTTALAYRRIDLSAKVLTTVMILEVITVVVFDVAAFITGGPADGGGATLAMPWISDNSIGLAILFVVGNFLGFEATVIYREEVKDPNKTIPRATYLAVAGIGLFYALAAWAFVSFFGADQVQGAATDDTAGMFTHAMTGLVGKTIVDVISILLLTSIIASALAIQNVSARYLFSLGTDRVLPAFLGKVHRHHRSPYISASLIGAVWAAAVVIFALVGASPDSLYAKASGSGTFAILVLMLAASVAVVVYFRRNRATGPNATWKTFVAPVIAALGFAGITVLAIANYSELIGDTGLVTTLLLVITFAIPVVGVLVARTLRVKRPDVYQRIGRQQI